MFKYEYVDEPERKFVKLKSGPGKFLITGVSLNDKTGKPYPDGMMVSMEVWDELGTKTVHNDYFAGNEKMLWRLRALCKSIGYPQLIKKTGTLDEKQLIKCHGPCTIEYITERYKDKELEKMKLKFLERNEHYSSPLKNTRDEESKIEETDDVPF